MPNVPTHKIYSMPNAPTHNVKIDPIIYLIKSYLQKYNSYLDSKKRSEFQIINLKIFDISMQQNGFFQKQKKEFVELLIKLLTDGIIDINRLEKIKLAYSSKDKKYLMQYGGDNYVSKCKFTVIEINKEKIKPFGNYVSSKPKNVLQKAIPKIYKKLNIHKIQSIKIMNKNNKKTYVYQI